ncbi:MAG: hypothetical protein ABR611_00100 [Chthoniobacterales bacterium]
MKFLSSSVIAIILFSFAGCATETQTTTTTRTSQQTSTTDTSALDPARNTNMQPTSDNSMGPR